MELGVMLLYVGAVLCVNGIWLVGQARATAYGAAAAEAPGAGVEVEKHPTFIEGREVAILNIFTGFIGVAVSVTLLIRGAIEGDVASLRGTGFILLFAFTYLWVAANAFLNAGGHAFGWYCLFVAITAVFAGIYVFIDNPGGDANTANVWLGIDWFAWALLWGMFWVLLSLERPIARLTGYVAILEGIGTSWVFGFLLLEGRVNF